MPLQIVVGEKKLKENKVELKVRKTNERFDVDVNNIFEKVKELLM